MRTAAGAGAETADGEAELELTWESVPVRTESVSSHMRNDGAEDIPYTGDRGIRLGDVFDGKADMKSFLAQMSDDDLCCIVKGEGMCSPKVTPGTAAAFGGLTESLQKLGIPCGSAQTDLRESYGLRCTGIFPSQRRLSGVFIQ